MMQPPGTLIRNRQHLSLDDFDYGFFDYDRPRRRITDGHISGLLTPDTFTVLPPLPPPTPSPPPAPRTYRFTSPTRRQRKASFVILTSPQPQLLPGSARSTRAPSPTDPPRKITPAGKSRIPRSQPVSREPSPTRKKSVTQQRRASVSPVKGELTRKTSVKRDKDGAHPSPSRIPRPPVTRPRKSPAPSRDPSPSRKNSKTGPQKKGPPPPVSRQQQIPVLRKNSNFKPLASKPPLPPAARGRMGNNKPAPKTSLGAKSGKPSDSSKPTDSKKSVSSKSESGSKHEQQSVMKSQDTCVYVNPTMASAPATTSAPATSSSADLAAGTSTTTANAAPTTSTSTTPPPPDTTSALVSTTTHPALELAEPTTVEASKPPKSSSAGSKVSATGTSEEKSAPAPSASASATADATAAAASTTDPVAGSMESVRTEDSGVTVRAASSPRPKKKAAGDDVTTKEELIKGEPDLESLSPNTQQSPEQPEQAVSGTGGTARLPVAPASGVEAAGAASQSGGGGLLARLCPCCPKFSSKLGKSVAGSRVGILGGSKVSTIGGSGAASKADLEDGPPPPAGKCECLRMILCCSRRGGKCCSCCKKADAGRRKSDAPSRLSKKASRTSSTAVEPDTRPKLDPSLVEQGSMMRGAIPVLPVPLAYICLFFNIIVPGFGTLTSGLFCLCFGKARFQPRDDPQGRCGSFVVNVVVGAAQLFTVIFCLVGWGWSIWWGVIMLRIAKKYRKLKLAEANQQDNNLAAPVTQQNHDVERGRPAQ